MPRSEQDYYQCDWNDAQLYWATIHYMNWWWRCDGPWLHVVRKAGGMQPAMLRRIAIEYNVSRMILGKEKSCLGDTGGWESSADPAAERLCAILNAARGAWPATMNERAEACVQLAQEARQQRVTKREAISAVTKFMWFLEPASWTVFDRFALKGLGLNEGVTARERMRGFYRALAERGFPALSADMQVEIDGGPFRGLPATRILDVLLMGRGGRGHDAESIAISRGFLQTLPVSICDAATALAFTLQSQFGQDVLRPSPRPY